MITESIYRSTGITRITGLEVKQFANGGLIFEPHEYIGKEPDTKFTVRQIKKIAEKLRIPLNVAFYGCSDEENDLERMKWSFYCQKIFRVDMIGTQVFAQSSEVADKKGHSAYIFYVDGHMGMYKNMEDARILIGKVESEKDEVKRPACGAIYHVMNRILGTEKAEHLEPWDIDLIGKLEDALLPYKEEFLKAYESGIDELESLSNGMKFLVKKNVEVQVARLLKVLTESHDADSQREKKLVFGGITINRFKDAATSIITQAYLVDENKIIDLTKRAV